MAAWNTRQGSAFAFPDQGTFLSQQAANTNASLLGSHDKAGTIPSIFQSESLFLRMAAGSKKAGRISNERPKRVGKIKRMFPQSPQVMGNACVRSQPQWSASPGYAVFERLTNSNVFCISLQNLPRDSLRKLTANCSLEALLSRNSHLQGGWTASEGRWHKSEVSSWEVTSG